jgi:hypothetical protein
MKRNIGATATAMATGWDMANLLARRVTFRSFDVVCHLSFAVRAPLPRDGATRQKSPGVFMAESAIFCRFQDKKMAQFKPAPLAFRGACAALPPGC